MKIARLNVVGFKGLEAINLIPMGKHLIARGKNGVGKTSLVESIGWALTGDGKAPLRTGADEAKVSIDFGVFAATRKKDKNGKTSIVAKRADGKPIDGGAAAFLKQMVGPGIGIAPLHLFALRDEDQVDAILKAIKVDISASKAAEKATFEQRADANREAKQKAAERAALVAQGADAAVAPKVDPSELMRKANEARARVEAANRRDQSVIAAIQALDLARIALESAQKQFEACETKLDVARAAPIDKTARVDLEAAESAIRSMSETNAAAERHDAYVKATLRVTQLEERSRELTNALERAAADRAALVTKAAESVGIIGLALEPDGSALTYPSASSGLRVRLAELSTGEKIVFATRLVAGTKPELQILLADEASALDDDGLAKLFELGKDLDIQLVLAQVSNKPVMEILMVDGEDGLIVEKTEKTS